MRKVFLTRTDGWKDFLIGRRVRSMEFYFWVVVGGLSGTGLMDIDGNSAEIRDQRAAATIDNPLISRVNLAIDYRWIPNVRYLFTQWLEVSMSLALLLQVRG
jgi:hypothetical protein